MIVGVGLDVCSIERMRKALDRHGDRFFGRICSPAERADMAERDQAVALAGRFAAKEAFTKACGGTPGVGWHEVEVRRVATGRPRIDLRGKALALVASLGANRWHVSITHDAGIAAAVVILEHAPA
jgi:holo-[acyl-carrier protein] synthase